MGPCKWHANGTVWFPPSSLPIKLKQVESSATSATTEASSETPASPKLANPVWPQLLPSLLLFLKLKKRKKKYGEVKNGKNPGEGYFSW
jgi:hypothetical protein